MCGKQRQHAADKSQRHRAEQKQRIASAPEGAVEQKENDQQTDRNDNLQPRNGGLKFLEFPRPFIVEARRDMDLRGELSLGFGDGALEIAAANAELHRDVTAVVFAV